jgi:hypothetical protein
MGKFVECCKILATWLWEKLHTKTPLSTAYFLIFVYGLFSAAGVMTNSMKEMTDLVFSQSEQSSPQKRVVARQQLQADSAAESAADITTPEHTKYLRGIFLAALFLLIVQLCLHQLLVYYDLAMNEELPDGRSSTKTSTANPPTEKEQAESDLFIKLKSITDTPKHNILMLCNALLLVFLSGKLTKFLHDSLNLNLCFQQESVACDLFYAKVFSLSAFLICLILIGRNIWVYHKRTTLELTSNEKTVLNTMIGVDGISFLAVLFLMFVNFFGDPSIRLAFAFFAALCVVLYFFLLCLRWRKIYKVLKYCGIRFIVLLPFAGFYGLTWLTLKYAA